MPSHASITRTIRLSIFTISRTSQTTLSRRCTDIASPRFLSTSSPLSSGSPLFNLNGLANSRETQHFSRERRIPRTEFSPQLQLLRSSEVDPFAPAPGASADAVARAKARDRKGSQDKYTPQDASSCAAADMEGLAYGQTSHRNAVALALSQRRTLLEAEVQALKDKLKQVEKRLENNQKEGANDTFFLLVLVLVVGLMAAYKDPLFGYVDQVKAQLVQEFEQFFPTFSRPSTVEPQANTTNRKFTDTQPSAKLVSDGYSSSLTAEPAKQLTDGKQELGTSMSTGSWLSRAFWASPR